jgi:hypothetical protein
VDASVDIDSLELHEGMLVAGVDVLITEDAVRYDDGDRFAGSPDRRLVMLEQYGSAWWMYGQARSAVCLPSVMKVS